MEGRHFAYVLRLYMERARLKAHEEKMRLAKSRPTSERDDQLLNLAKDIRTYWKNLAEISSIKDKWRKIEDGGLSSTIRICSKIKGKFNYIQTNGIDREEASKITAIFEEFAGLQQLIGDTFIGMKSKNKEDEEFNKRFYKANFGTMLEMLAGTCIISGETMAILKESWEEKREFVATAKTVCNTCLTSVKAMCVSADISAFPVPNENREAVLQSTLRQSTRTCNSLSIILQMLQHSSEEGGPTEALLEMATWILYGLDHVSNYVIRPLLNESPNESIEFQERYRDVLDKMFGHLKPILEQYTIGLYDGGETEIEKHGEAPNADDKDNSSKENDTLKETKDEQEKTDESPNENSENVTNQETVCSAAIEMLSTMYDKVAAEVLGSGKVSVGIEDPLDPDIRLLYRPEQHREIAGCGIGPCEMKDRSKWLTDLALTDEQILISDIYVITHGPLQTTNEVDVQFTATPISGSEQDIIVKVKSGGVWQVMENVNRHFRDGLVQLSFKTKDLEAFMAYVENPSDAEVIKPEGCAFTSPINRQVSVQFPEGIVDEEKPVRVRFVSVDKKEATEYREKNPDAFTGLIDISDVVEIYTDTPIETKKNSIVQLAMDGDDTSDGKDTHLVVIRYNEEQCQILDGGQCRITKKEQGIYKVEVKGIWCIGLARIKKIFVNMRETVKREFMVMVGKVQLCNVVTFVDDTLRDNEKGLITIWIELLEKGTIKEAIEDRAKDGLIEVKSSRSRDLAFKSNETIQVQLEGQIRVVGAPLTEKYVLTYLQSASNHIVVPLEIKRDEHSPPHAAFMFRETHAGHGMPFHTVCMPVRDLTELPSEMLESRITIKYNERNNVREEQKKRDDAASHTLSHRSLMCLAREISPEDCSKLGEQLGLSKAAIKKIRDQHEKDPVSGNFRIISEWRGKSARAAMVTFLENTLKIMGLTDFSKYVGDAFKGGRGLRKGDFHQPVNATSKTPKIK